MATRAEILSIVTSQEGYETPPEGVISYALRMYSRKFPLMLEVSYSDMLDETEIELDSEVYSSNITCTVTVNNYEYQISNFEFIPSLNKIKFYTPLLYDDITVYYYTSHILTAEACTIPDMHLEAFAYLLCYFMSMRAISEYYNPDSISQVDNGIINVRFDTSKSSGNKLKTYYERYLEAISADSPIVGYIRDDIPEISSTSDVINWPYTTEW
jgi:hypothetical protein